MQYDPYKHQPRSIRLKGNDYAQPGAYFVTICAYRFQHLFGEVVDGEMVLNEVGRIVLQSWRWLAERYIYVSNDIFIVMPNHFHAILMILDDDELHRRGASRGAQSRIKRKPLGQLIGAFKTVSTKQINLLQDTPGGIVWQRNFYEHIIRNEREHLAIEQYILNNPMNWQFDRDNV